MKKGLAWRYVKTNMKRSALTVLGIAMALAMMMCIGNAISTVLDMSRMELYDRFGTWETMFALESAGDTGNAATAADIAAQDNVQQTAAIYENTNMVFPQLREEGMTNEDFLWMSTGNIYVSLEQSVLDMMHMEISEGSFPKDASEAIISMRLADELGIGIGDTLECKAGSINIGDSVETSDGEFETPISFEGEDRAVRVVGLTDTDDAANQGLFSSSNLIAAGPGAGEPTTVMVKFERGTNQVLRSEAICSDLGIAPEGMSINQAVYTTSFSSLMTQMFVLGVIFIFCCCLIAFAAISIVRNSFSMSVTERMRDYGLLRCAGATQRQIRSLIRSEVFILLGIAFPLGFAISYAASVGVLGIVNNMALLGIPKLHLSMSWFFVLLSLGVALISMVIAVVGPSRKASNVSPLLITNGQDEAKEIKGSTITRKSRLARFFGVEWELATRNRRASGKRSRTTIFSMTVSVALLLCTAGMMQTYLLPQMQESESEIDIEVATSEYADPNERISEDDFAKFCAEAATVDGVTSSAVVKSTELNIKMPRDRMNNPDLLEDIYGSDGENIWQTMRVKYIGRNEYRMLQEQNGELSGMSYDQWLESGEAILNDYVTASEVNEYGRTLKSERASLYKLPADNNLTVTAEDMSNVETHTQEDVLSDSITVYGYASPDEPMQQFIDLDFQIGKKVKSRVWYDDIYSSESMPIIYCPVERWEEDSQTYYDIDSYTRRNLMMKTDPLKNAGIEDAMFEMSDGGIYVNNNYSQEIVIRNVILLISICVYSFVGVIALISCLNIINIISTNLVLRKRDFGLLQAVGMNVRQMRKMIVYECIQFSLRSMLFGSVLGFAALAALHVVVTSNTMTAFYISPWTVAGIFIGCFLVSIIASWPTWKKLRKVSIMESIRHIG